MADAKKLPPWLQKGAKKGAKKGKAGKGGTKTCPTCGGTGKC